MKERCYLVSALAPEGVNAAEADDLFNDYIADRDRSGSERRPKSSR